MMTANQRNIETLEDTKIGVGKARSHNVKLQTELRRRTYNDTGEISP